MKITIVLKCYVNIYKKINEDNFIEYYEKEKEWNELLNYLYTMKKNIYYKAHQGKIANFISAYL